MEAGAGPDQPDRPHPHRHLWRAQGARQPRRRHGSLSGRRSGAATALDGRPQPGGRRPLGHGPMPGWRRGHGGDAHLRTRGMTKRPFDIDDMLGRIETAVAPYPKAAMFELADKGFTSAFEQLVACIISIRTYDEVSLVAAQRLFARARTPAEVAAL